ncbi:oligopeptide ABC transporter substrate-binding protein [Spiroplasma helicoides]|uniref:Oligopeptide ABC transporter substrate-binding protein n=1 Tax=Spiroplasma helicoides TaxID=216938 RepID=A0A1B3SKJ1_9MOLU|nr:ABC transporter substrate-binding protein [Spiroplasma helicoides]AOG60458.1 oligopeptide ABC transporter substrate-binding protein [Spiroplasma helicoides]
MKITSKKLLSTLSAFAGVGLASSSVVACGFNIQKIIDREAATDTYIKTFSYAMTSWNTAYTMQAEDHKVLANTNATPLGVDEYGRVYGDIFESGDIKEQYIGKPQDDYKTWTYKIRDNAHWYKYDGTDAGKIKASDFEKAAEFIMRASQTGSQVANLWKGFIVGAQEVSEYLSKNPTASWSEAKSKAGTSGFGLTVNDDNGTVTYKLKKSAPYFESLLCYAVFSPMHSESENVADVGQISDFTKGYYSGAYLPTKVDSQTEMVLEKNQNYWFKDLVTINKIKYLNAAKGTTSLGRTLFEAGDTSEFKISSSDNQGWERYIGSDIDNPTFNYLYDAPSADSVSTYVLYMNTYNSLIDDNNQNKIKASKLLQNKLARALIATGIDRSVFVKLYSEKFDGDSDKSKMLRNVYTAPGVASFENEDYSKTVEKAVNKIAGKTDLSLSDGSDPLKDNVKLYTKKDLDSLIKELRKYMKNEGIIDNEQDTFTINYLQNPDHVASLNPKLNIMFERFNAIPNNPIKIESIAATSSDEYIASAQKGNYDLYIGGWGPDYADPATYLNTIAINGDLSTYTGVSRLLTKNSSGSYDAKVKTTSADGTADYIKQYTSFDEAITKIDNEETSDIKKRYADFAEQEANYLYKDFFMIPFYTMSAPKNYSISYVLPYTTNYSFTYGIAAYKDWSKIMQNRIVSLDQANEQKQRVENYKEEIKNDANKKKNDMTDRNHILFDK